MTALVTLAVVGSVVLAAIVGAVVLLDDLLHRGGGDQ